jgi:hypothetical protein
MNSYYEFAFDNGFVCDLNKLSVKKYEHNNDRFTCGYNYNVVDSKYKNELMNILKNIFPNENELKYALKTIAYGLIKENENQDIYVWIGNGGSNGVSLLKNLVKITFGNYFCYMDLTTLSYDTFRYDPKLKNCRIIYDSSNQIDKNMKLNAGLIKLLVS